VFSSRYGANFDEDIKKWRFMSILALNLSIYTELATLLYPKNFLLLASTANICKNICLLLAAVSRGAINMRFAKRSNVGDISGKYVSQFTSAQLLGMTIGLGFSQVIQITNLSHLVPICLGLSLVNVYTTYKSACVVAEVHLNN
jgi:hypothetical protein